MMSEILHILFSTRKEKQEHCYLPALVDFVELMFPYFNWRFSTSFATMVDETVCPEFNAFRGKQDIQLQTFT